MFAFLWNVLGFSQPADLAPTETIEAPPIGEESPDESPFCFCPKCGTIGTLTDFAGGVKCLKCGMQAPRV
jgi:hypothetical protein